MKVVIFGASGRTGQELVQQALLKNYQVTAVVRNATKLAHFKHLENLAVTEADIFDATAIAAILAGKDSVLCALGGPEAFSRKVRTTPNLLFDSAKIIVSVMQQHGLHRIVCLSSFGVGDSLRQKNFLGYLYRYIFVPLALRAEFADKERQETVLKTSSNLEWVLVRPTSLMSRPAKGLIKVDPKNPRATITRADVATFMLQCLVTDAYLYQTPTLSN
jgi:putative NADH-flavin reductase